MGRRKGQTRRTLPQDPRDGGKEKVVRKRGVKFQLQPSSDWNIESGFDSEQRIARSSKVVLTRGMLKVSYQDPRERTFPGRGKEENQPS